MPDFKIEPVRRSDFAEELSKNEWIEGLRPLVEKAAENGYDDELAYRLPFGNADELVKQQRRMGEATRFLGASMRSKIVDGTSLLFWFRPAVSRTRKENAEEAPKADAPKPSAPKTAK